MRCVTKTYTVGSREVAVLREVSLTVQAGEFVAIVGPSGSGKSTLLNLVTGIDRPSAGEVYVGGQPLHTMSEDALAAWRGRNVGILFQFFQLLPTLTVLENVLLAMDFGGAIPPSQRLGRARRLLQTVGIPEHADKLPSALSGGEQQRAALARALANDPPLLVADEPTGNLDTATAQAVFDLLAALNQAGKTLLIVTHDLALSARAGRTIHLRDGCIEQVTEREEAPAVQHLAVSS